MTHYLVDKKLKSKKGLLLVFVFLLFLSWSAYDPAVYWEDIRNKYIPLYDAEYSGKQDRSWIPFIVRYHPRQVFSDLFRPKLIIGFPDIDMTYVVHENDSEIILTLHVFNNLVRGITIIANSKGEDQATLMIDKINKDHPFLPFQLVVRDHIPIDNSKIIQK